MEVRTALQRQHKDRAAWRGAAGGAVQGAAPREPGDSPNGKVIFLEGLASGSIEAGVH